MVRAFLKSPSGLLSLAMVLLLLAAAIFAPIAFGESAQFQDFSRVAEQPSAGSLLGTDGLGRSVLERLLVATRLSLTLAVVAAVVALVLGITMGISTVVMGSRARGILLRVIDTMIAFPSILIVIVITVVLGKGTLSVVIGVGFAFSFGFARLASTLAMSVGGREYINAARVVGVQGPRLLWRYVLPNIAEPLTVAFSLTVTGSILTISALSFLGLGVQAPQYDWGLMLAEGLPTIYSAPVSALAPALMIAFAALGFGLFGEALARAFNPLLWTAGSKRASVKRVARRDVHEAGPSTQIDSASDATGIATKGKPVLEVEDLVVTYPTPAGPVDIVKGVSFTLAEGEVLGIVGESGSGKTMTALAVAQLPQFPAQVSGRVTLRGNELRTMSSKQLDKLLGTDLAFVFQDPSSSLNPAIRIGPQLTEAIRTHKKVGSKKSNEMAVSTLTEMHIPAPSRQLKRFPHELSGGMRQRVMIGKGLIKEPTLLVADEPTTALDVTVQAQIMSVLDEVNESHGTAIILISHNLALVSQSCDRVAVMYAGRIVEELPAGQLGEGPLHPYTRALLAAVPEFGHPRDAKLASIPGEMPDLSATPPGCAYHPRCPLATDRCRTERPELLIRPDDVTRRVACHVANDDVSEGLTYQASSAELV